jgi:hypothetical protein
MNRTGVLALLGVAFVLYLYGQSTYTQRFRLTIDVQTPDGTKSGSSVIETSAWESGEWGPPEARGIRRSFKGRAVFVDLGNGKNVVALLAFGPEGRDQSKLFGMASAALAPSGSVDWKDEYKLKGAGVLPREYTPTLITFADLADPKTARLVDPANIEEAFGRGYAFKAALLETTSESASGGIDYLGGIRPDVLRNRRTERGSRGSTIGESLEPELLFQRR